MTHDEFEAKRNNGFLNDINLFVEKLGEPEHFVTFFGTYSDLYAIYAESHSVESSTTRLRVYFDPYLETDEMIESSISFDVGDYMQPVLSDKLIRTMIAAHNHQDEPLSYFYECMDELVIHEKGWRPQFARK